MHAFQRHHKQKVTKSQSFCFITPQLSGRLAANYKDIEADFIILVGIYQKVPI